MAKFMLSIGDESFSLLTGEAKDRGIKVQELIRAVIIPEWVRLNLAQRATTVSSLLPSNGQNGGTLSAGEIAATATAGLARVKAGTGTRTGPDKYQSLYFRSARR